MDTLTPQERSERMARVRGKDTKPEIFVRKLIWGMGYRYRLHDVKLPGKPDLIFPSRKKVIFVHGCFWHRHRKCSLARLPKSRLDFWFSKLEGNRKRDLKKQRKLKKLGWDFMVIWECELSRKMELQKRIVKFLGKSM